MGIGKLLQDLIDNNNTNVLDVSKATGVAATTIYSIIRRDSKSANISDLAKIAHHLGVTLDYFYENESNDSKISLSEHEQNLIIAYRNQPAMQEAVDKLLGLPTADMKELVDDIIETTDFISNKVNNARSPKGQK